MIFTLTDKLVLVTGASRGIGAAVAVRMAQLGASVVINYRRNRERALEVLQRVGEAGNGMAMIIQADVTQRRAVEKMEQAVREKLGAADVLVNNAASPFELNPLHEISWDGLREAINREVSSLHNCTQVFVPGMIEKKRGKFIIVSSRLTHQPLPRLGAYTAAKAALEAMANTMAIELGPFGITVNIVAPAFTLTEGSSVMPEGFKERVRRSRPLQKHLYPEDVAGAVAFLATDDADMITGSSILVTGGSHFQF
ncbi:MAG: SDR family NAD(P)-dependent oxidoreductase [Candidatus Binatia bacterium]